MNKSSVIGEILIEGDLVLKSPLLIGDGEGEMSENFRDVHILKNRQGEPFIPGTSFCGVLREWMEDFAPAWTTKIFGDAKEMQSSIQFEDIVLSGSEIIPRDGVRIDGLTGTVDDDGKYDFEVIDRGATSKLRLVVTLRGVHVEKNFDGDKNYSLEEISEVIAQMLGKLRDGLRLGALTTKGFGSVVIENLDADLYDFRDGRDVAAWLLSKPATEKILPAEEKNFASPNDFVVDALFKFKSSFIIRDYEAADKEKNISSATPE